MYSSRIAGAVKNPPQSCHVPAARPTSSASSRRAHSSGGSPGTSSLPAGSSSRYSPTASLGWRTISTWSCSTGTITTAPGCAMTSRRTTMPSGRR